MQTPNLDALASKSLVMKRAYAQQSLCVPSRASVLTGRRPDTTGVTDFTHYWRESGGNFTTIPQYFKENGYHSVGMGKIFHPGGCSGNDDPISWSEDYFQPNVALWESVTDNSWTIVDDDVRSNPLPDMQIAQHAVETLKRLAGSSQDQPFFLAVGFVRPHLPLAVPEEFFDLYPLEDIPLPSNPNAPDRMPELAWSNSGELRQYADFRDGKWYGDINVTLPEDVVRNSRRAYLAGVSYTDSLIGQVLDALDEEGLTSKTIIALWSDHGFHLGENGLWSKSTNFEVANRVPLMVSAPGQTDNGVKTDALVELVDLFPSLAELAGFPSIPICPEDSTDIKVCSEGLSFVPLIADPEREWKKAAFSQSPRMAITGDTVMGYSIRTDTIRYTEWTRYDKCLNRPPSMGSSLGTELYDYAEDPGETTNRQNLMPYRERQEDLQSILHGGWREALPNQ
jgi:iduronate 2-sulfatase